MKKSKKEELQPDAEDLGSVTLTKHDYDQLKQDAEKSREYWDRLLRMQADFENTRKRLEREKQEFIRFANEGLVYDLLNVVDDLERSLQLAQGKHEDFAAFLKGTEMVLAHLYDLLKKQGLSSIEAKGKVFDPSYHEALPQVETDDLPENTITEELQKGYLLNERVIRTAKVKVAKPASPGPVEDNGQCGQAEEQEQQERQNDE